MLYTIQKRLRFLHSTIYERLLVANNLSMPAYRIYFARRPVHNMVPLAREGCRCFLYLEHLVEMRAAAGDGVCGGRLRPQASLTHVFELQHCFLTSENLNDKTQRHGIITRFERHITSCSMLH